MKPTEFQQTILKSGKPVVVDFWAPWCMPCRMTKPILEKLAAEYDAQVDFLAVNADDSRDLLEQFNIIGIPTVLALRDGKVVGRVTGAQPETGYRAMFTALAEEKEINIPISTFDRTLRLGAGFILLLIGFMTGNWIVVALGAIVAFLGFYDRCPLWNALTRMVRQALP